MNPLIIYLIVASIAFLGGTFTTLLLKLSLSTWGADRMQDRTSKAYAEVRSLRRDLLHMRAKTRLCHAIDCPFRAEGRAR